MENSKHIISYIEKNPNSSSSQIFEGAELGASYATVRRVLSRLCNDGTLVVTGKGRSRRYSISPSYKLVYEVDMDSYYKKEVDDRAITDSYNFDLIYTLSITSSLFTKEELVCLNNLQQQFSHNISHLSANEKKSEMDRLGIDLSWKSSQIEGNTYSLLETERLLKEKETAQGKTKDEAIMLLNHKDALDFILDNPEFLSKLTVANIESIHSILTKDLAIDRNIRTRRVGITGTIFSPCSGPCFCQFHARPVLGESPRALETIRRLFPRPKTDPTSS